MRMQRNTTLLQALTNFHGAPGGNRTPINPLGRDCTIQLCYRGKTPTGDNESSGNIAIWQPFSVTMLHMAFAGTHIRLALDFAEQLKVRDIDAFLSGTIYPDSRYHTGVDRSVTHNEEFIRPDFFRASDFKKGWAMHLVCDRVQREVFDTLGIFPDERISGASRAWVSLTIRKLLQDVNDVTLVSPQMYASLFDYVEAPNGENPEAIIRYNKAIQEGYAVIPPPIDNYVRTWGIIGLDPVLIKQLKKKYDEDANDADLNDRLGKSYEAMCERTRQILIQEHII